MKKPILTIAILSLMTMTISTSCSSSDEKVTTTEENANPTQEASNSKFEEEIQQFTIASEEKIKENEKLIEEFKSYLGEKNEDIKEGFEKSIADIEQRNKQLKIKIADYKESGAENWENFKKEFNHDMDELHDAITNMGKDNVK